MKSYYVKNEIFYLDLMKLMYTRVHISNITCIQDEIFEEYVENVVLNVSSDVMMMMMIQEVKLMYVMVFYQM